MSDEAPLGYWDEYQGILDALPTEPVAFNWSIGFNQEDEPRRYFVADELRLPNIADIPLESLSHLGLRQQVRDYLSAHVDRLDRLTAVEISTLTKYFALDVPATTILGQLGYAQHLEVMERRNPEIKGHVFNLLVRLGLQTQQIYPELKGPVESFDYLSPSTPEPNWRRAFDGFNS